VVHGILNVDFVEELANKRVFRVGLLHVERVEWNNHVESGQHFPEPKTLVQLNQVKLQTIGSFLVGVLLLNSVQKDWCLGYLISDVLGRNHVGERAETRGDIGTNLKSLQEVTLLELVAEFVLKVVTEVRRHFPQFFSLVVKVEVALVHVTAWKDVHIVFGELSLHIVREGSNPIVKLTVVVVFLKRSFTRNTRFDFLLLLLLSGVDHSRIRSCLFHSRVFFLCLRLRCLETLLVHLFEDAHS